METPPKELFRYRKADHIEEEIKRAYSRQEIWFSSMTNQNDPFDSKPAFKPASLKELNSTLRSVYRTRPVVQGTANLPQNAAKRKRLLKQLRPSVGTARVYSKAVFRAIGKLQSNTKIACLCESPERTLMWSHYTSSHTGFCLGFAVDIAKLRPSLGSFLMQVVYSSKRETISEAETVPLLASHSNYTGAEATKLVESIYGTKSNEWSYEEEWRAWVSDHENAGYRPFPALRLQRIIFGVNAADSTIQTAKRICQNDVKFQRIALDDSEYRLNLLDV